jgi:hypothetical protein
MKNVALALAVMALLPLTASADVTKEDIRKLAAAGISDDVILAYIRSNGPISKFSAGDVVDLKQAGASERVLTALMSAPAPVAAPEVRPQIIERVVEKPVYVPQTTYVVDTTTRWCSSHYSYDGCAPYYAPTYYYGGYHHYPRYYSSYYSSGYRGCSPRGGWSVGFGW